jgi:hypothetical protein
MAYTRGPIAGAASLTVDGEPYNITASDFRPSGYKAETLKGQTQVEGYSEMPFEGYITATVRLLPNQQANRLVSARNVTVVLVRRSGQTVYGAGMWQTEDAGTNSLDGTMSVKFEGALVTEEVAAVAA